MKKPLALVLTFFFASILSAFADSIEGVWRMNDGKATMRVTIEKGKLVGRITAVKDKSRTHDTNNPDPKLRHRKIIGLPIVWGFHKKGDKWEGGRVYDSSDGKMYKGKIWMEGKNTLVMRGFVGVSLLGKSAKWTRVK